VGVVAFQSLIIQQINNSFCLLVLVDILRFHSYNIHNNRLVLASKYYCNFHIRKNIHKKLSALFSLFYIRNWDK